MAATSFYGGEFFGGEFFNAGAEAVVGQVPAGRKLRRPERWVVAFRGKDLVFASVEALLAFLTAQVAVEERRVVTVAERHARRILRVKARPQDIVAPRLAITTNVPEAQVYLEEAERRIDRIYRNALGSALARDADEMEDIAVIAGIL